MADDDLSSLELYNGPRSEIVTGNRSPRPASQTAENITVVTAEEIAALNAHTLADVLYCVTGIQLEMNRTPGTSVNFKIQGSNFNHVLVLIDNVPINNLADNFADISSIPVQMIERIEVVKGAASTSWGSALGGVVNVITKAPRADRSFSGTVSGSWGTSETVDGRAEISGTEDRFGYYLTAGRLRSDGLLPNNEVGLKSMYGKLLYDLPGKGTLTLTTGVIDNSSGQVFYRGVDVDQQNRQLISTLALQYPLTPYLNLDTSVRTRQGMTELKVLTAPAQTLLQTARGSDTDNGASLKVSWLGDRQTVAAGIDVDHVRTLYKGRQGDASELTRADRLGIYLNDTVTVGRFAITPSARFDRTGSGGDHFSPSFGVTYSISDNTVVRGYTAKGYSLTSLSRSSSTEKVWTSQLGVETGEIPYLWLKATLFRNDTDDVRINLPGLTVKQRQLKEGGELELRTLPLYNTSLSTGYTFMEAREGEHGRELPGVPRHSVNIGVKYKDPRDFQADLTGHYIDWNNAAGRYGAVVWDLHLRQVLELGDELSLELFASLRNIFNGAQYLDGIYRNAGRWGEAGVRCNF